MDILSNHRRFVGKFRIEIKEETSSLSSSMVAAIGGRSSSKSNTVFMYLFTDCILFTTQSTSKKDVKPYKFSRRLLFKHLTILNKKMDVNGDILPFDDLTALSSSLSTETLTSSSSSSPPPPLMLRLSYSEPKPELICIMMAEEKQMNAVCSCVFSFDSGSSSKGSMSSQEQLVRKNSRTSSSS